MRPKILLRIASILLLIFSMGHTMGHVGRKQTTDPRARALIKEMEDYRYDIMGSSQTVDGHLDGFSIMFTFALVSLSILTWIVSSNVDQHAGDSRKILFPVLLFMIGSAYVSHRYFFVIPAVFSDLVMVLILISMWLLG